MKTISAAVLLAAVLGCSSDRAEWGCCEVYPVLSAERAPDDSGMVLRLLDCDGVREFTCFSPDGVDFRQHPEAMVCHDDAGASVPYWSADRGC